MAESTPRITGPTKHFLECGIKDCERLNCEFYCNPCHQQMCKQCRDEHLRNPKTKTHEVVIYQFWKRQLPVKKCEIHPTKDIDLLCEECKIPLCSKCTATPEHRGHVFTDLETIYAEKFSFCLEEITKMQEYFLPTSQDIQKEIQEDATEIKKIMDNLRTSMKPEAESLKSLVDKVQTEIMKQIDQIEHSLLKDLKTQEKTFDEYIKHLNNLIKEFQDFLSSPDPTKLTLTPSLVDMTIQPIPETTKPVTPEFTAGQYSKKDVAKLLGKISNPEIKPETRKIKPMEIPSLPTQKKPTSKQLKSDKGKSNVKQTLSLSRTVTEVKEFTVPGVDNVFHVSLDQSGKLWVSDKDGNLVQTDLQGNQLQKIQTSCEGFGYHTTTQDGDLIFTDMYKKVINRITLDNNITEFIKTGDWAPVSIHSSHINGDLLVGMMKDREGKVTRYNKKGKELQNIQRDNKGQGLYSDPYYITENINGDICTVDINTKTIVVVNKSGQHRFSYRGQESEFYPFGICTDVLGHILVCDLKNIHLLDQDGQFLSQLITHKETGISPISVCVDNENNIYVGRDYSVKVKVYKYLQ